MAAICSWHLVSLPEPDSARERRENNPKTQAAQKQPQPHQPSPGEAGQGAGRCHHSCDTSKVLELGKLHSPCPLWGGRGQGDSGRVWGAMKLFLTSGTQDSKNSLQEPQPRAMLVCRGPAEAPGAAEGGQRWQRHRKGQSGDPRGTALMAPQSRGRAARRSIPIPPGRRPREPAWQSWQGKRGAGERRRRAPAATAG